MDPSRGLDSANRNTAVRIVEKRKMPAGEVAQGEDATGKRRRLGWGSAGPEFCDHLLFMLVLAAVDIKTLLRCLALGRSWNSLIRSSGFRQLWAGQNETGVLLSSLLLRGCDFWIPGSNRVSPFILLPEFYRVVASASGLVCIQRESCDPLAPLSDDFPQLLVGNPVTDEWVHLPIPREGMYPFPSFRMEVVGKGGHFRVALCTGGSQPGTFTCYVYDSASGAWSKTKLFYPASDAGAKYGFFDLSREVWVTDTISSGSIRTGLESRDDEVHVLPHPRVHGFCFWEYRGQVYFASPWYVPGLNTTFSGFGVWRVDKASRKLEVVDAAWTRRFVDEQVLRVQEGSELLLIHCNAMGRYVCFSSDSNEHPAMPMIVYDLHTGCWTWTVRPCEHSDHSDHPEEKLNDTDYTSAVLYSPSLLAPGRFQVRD